jgi:hypothetical protein
MTLRSSRKPIGSFPDKPSSAAQKEQAVLPASNSQVKNYYYYYYYYLLLSLRMGFHPVAVSQYARNTNKALLFFQFIYIKVGVEQVRNFST